MTAPVLLERTIEGVGTIRFEQQFNEDGTNKRRDYWFTAEGNTRRRRMPSVTGILRDTWPKPALLSWYAKHGAGAETLLEQAARRGTAVHAFVQHYMETGTLLDTSGYPPEYAPYFQGIAAFLWDYDPRPLEVEQLVVHPELGYAGRLDLIAEVEHKRTLLDYKSNPQGRIYTEAHVQATGYVAGAERCGDPDIEQILLVGISDQGAYNVVVGGDASRLWGAALAFYDQMKRFERGLDGNP